MTVSQAADQLIQIIQRRREEGAELGELNRSHTHTQTAEGVFINRIWITSQQSQEYIVLRYEALKLRPPQSHDQK